MKDIAQVVIVIEPQSSLATQDRDSRQIVTCEENSTGGNSTCEVSTMPVIHARS